MENTFKEQSRQKSLKHYHEKLKGDPDYKRKKKEYDRRRYLEKLINGERKEQV